MTFKQITVSLIAAWFCFIAGLAGQSLPRRVKGAVRDANGNAVAGAQVSFRGGGFSTEATTDSAGEFVFENIKASNGTISVQAAGFAPQQRSWKSASREQLEIVLSVPSLSQQVTVTANRVATPVSQTAGSVAVLSSTQIASTPALSLDGILRQIPGFSLFRRTDSRVANPTTQGVSLRGVGASGASRALVLENGIPLNDPFGGWVYWDRVPRVAVDRVEVAEGGASDLYGSDAMGGVINVITRQAARSQASLDASYGNEDTPDASLWAGTEWRRWTGELSAAAFGTDGYGLVPASIRGPVDTPAGSNYTDLTLALSRQISNNLRAFVSGAVFGEARKNGTPIQTNRTHLRQLSAGLDWQSPVAGAFTLRGYGEAQLLDQNFSSIAASRASESLTDLQRVPAQEAGFSAQWQRELGTRQTWVAGFEASAVRGASDELKYSKGAVNSAVGAGGRQDIEGLYAEDILRLTPRWILTGTARYDHWRNFDALSTTLPLIPPPPGPSAVINFPPLSESAFSPRLALLRQVTSSVSLYASAFRAFRAPTLNELYRPFRVGNVLTLSNNTLGAERLDGAEVGAGYAPAGGKVRIHAALFWNQINQPIANVTLSATPSLITDQRQNLGSTLSRGLEVEARERIWANLLLTEGYQYAKATVLSFPGDAALQGLDVPQVPRQAFTFGANYSKAWLGTLSLEGRYTGVQYDDVLNQFSLGTAFEMDAMASHTFRRHFEVYGALENLTGQRYEVARVPYTELGPPILGRVGIRFNWGEQ
ncbi:MAG TPA: TonB-dependent receptor [Terriglobia bacterium]|nr:TonB-dependent receptor [Terriglobia bacterium]